MPQPVEVEDVQCTKETEMALLCVIDGKEHWVPKSQVLDASEVCAEGDEGTLVVSAWIAKEKGWI